MKRYTLKFNVADPATTTDSLRAAIEDILLRLHPRITYKIGRVAYASPQSMMAEIAADGKIELLESRLRGIEGKLPIVFESLGWGWIVSDSPANSSVISSQDLKREPLAFIEPRHAPAVFLLSKKALWLRYVLFLVLTLVLIFLLVEKA